MSKSFKSVGVGVARDVDAAAAESPPTDDAPPSLFLCGARRFLSGTMGSSREVGASFCVSYS